MYVNTLEATYTQTTVFYGHGLFLALPYLHIIFYLYNTHGKTYLYLYMPILYKQFVQYIHILIICINIYIFIYLNNVYI
jgi:hypothetical protein